MKKTQKQVIYLTKDELSKIRNLVLDEKHARLEPIRDIFLFLCFSGLRHSDVANLRKGDVKADSFESVNIKTGKRVAIEFNEITASILSKYKDIPLKDDKALPSYTNQALNAISKNYANWLESTKRSTLSPIKETNVLKNAIPNMSWSGPIPGVEPSSSMPFPLVSRRTSS